MFHEEVGARVSEGIFERVKDVEGGAWGKETVQMARLGTWQRRVFELFFAGVGIYLIVRSVDAYRTSERVTFPVLVAALALWFAVVVNGLRHFISKQPTDGVTAKNPTKVEAYTLGVVGYLMAISALLFAVLPGKGKDVGRRVLLFGGFLFFGIATTVRMFILRKRWRPEREGTASAEDNEAA